MCGVDVMLFSGYTPLIYASQKGKFHVVKHLVELKANIEAKDNDGMFFRFPSILFSFCITSHECGINARWTF